MRDLVVDKNGGVHPYYLAWMEGNIEYIIAMWNDNAKKNNLGVRAALLTLLENTENTGKVMQCIEYLWDKMNHRKYTQNAIQKPLKEFKTSPLFGCESHYLLLQDMHDLGIAPLTDKENKIYGTQLIFLILISPRTIKRIGMRCAIAKLPHDLWIMTSTMLLKREKS